MKVQFGYEKVCLCVFCSVLPKVLPSIPFIGGQFEGVKVHSRFARGQKCIIPEGKVHSEGITAQTGGRSKAIAHSQRPIVVHCAVGWPQKCSPVSICVVLASMEWCKLFIYFGLKVQKVWG